MELFNRDSNINFLGHRKIAAIFSALLIVGSILLLVINGLNFGVDFTGGTIVELRYDNPVNLEEVRNVLNDSEFEGAVVQNYGSANEVLIRLAPIDELDSSDISTEVTRLLGVSQDNIMRIEFVGAQVGEELTESGGLAMLFALFGILVYVAIRFQTRFSLGAIAALIHDIIVTVGFFALTQIDFDLSVLAAILAVIGYSLNDTIVVFDRIRENFKRLRNATPFEVCNISINQTMSRTIITGLTTLLVLSALFFLGGETIHGFSIALIVGVIVGTYSSIYVASPVTLALGISRQDLMPVEKEGEGLPDRP
ncbi:MAG: protein translocase subunit SecF [Gammaproteobacteria bacterium]|nr:protein translocase subunit SecF [Gammaproteobacteria bacterium]